MEIVVIVTFVLVVFLLGKPPSGPTGSSPVVELEDYLNAVARQQKQLRDGRLSDW